MKRVSLIALILLGVAASAAAYHPRRDEMERIVTLSTNLESATARLYERADNIHERFTGREQRSYRRLGEFNHQVRDFRGQVVANSSEPAAVADAFDELVASYTRASSSLDDLAGYQDLRFEWREVQRLMERLTDELGGHDHYWGGRRNNGPAMATISESTIVGVELRSKLRARRLTDGDEFLASLATPIEINDRVIAPAGSDALLRVMGTSRSDRGRGRERLILELVGLRIAGRMQTVESEAVTFEAVRKGHNNAAIIGGSAAVGAIIGILTNDDHRGEGAVTGAVVGAVAGTGVVLLTRGKTVELPAHQRIDFELTRSVRVRVPSGERDHPRQQSQR